MKRQLNRQAFLLLFLLINASLAFSQAGCVSPTITISAPTTLYCFTTPSMTFTATTTGPATSVFYQWKKNGVNYGTSSSTQLITIAVNDVITCELTQTNSCGNRVTVTSNSITIRSNPGYNLSPEVTISATKERICTGTTVTFTATNVSQSAVVSYQWLVNGSTVGTNSTVFTTNTLKDGAKLECIMWVSDCYNPNVETTKDYSNPIVMKVDAVLDPGIRISPSSASICKGSAVTFTATASQAGTNPVFQWKVNGNNVGNNSPSFTTTSLNNGDVVSCELTVDPTVSCASKNTAVSNAVSMQVQDILVPSVQITASQTEVCEGTPVRFEAAASNAGNSPLYQWQINGKNAGANSRQFVATALANGDNVRCILAATSNTCTAVDTSNVIVLRVFPAPVVQFSPSSLFAEPGQAVLLNARVQGDIRQHLWTPTDLVADTSSLTPYTVPLAATTLYKLWVQTADGCTDTASVWVTIFNKFYIPNSFTPNGDGKNDVFRIPPSATFELENFSVFDRWGNRVFYTTDITKGWDGKYNGVSLSGDTFVYMISGKNNKGDVLVKGTVQLIR